MSGYGSRSLQLGSFGPGTCVPCDPRRSSCSNRDTSAVPVSDRLVRHPLPLRSTHAARYGGLCSVSPFELTGTLKRSDKDENGDFYPQPTFYPACTTTRQTPQHLHPALAYLYNGRSGQICAASANFRGEKTTQTKSDRFVSAS